MNLEQLRYLRAVLRTGSVTAAAAQEHVAQPSVSKQLRQVERELGVALFHRVGRRVVPTDAAWTLAACAGRVLDDIDATVAALSGGGASEQRLSICATETVSDNLLPAVLSRLRGQSPGVRVTVEMLGTDDAVQRLLADAADLAIVALPLREPRLEILPLFEEDVLLVTGAGHPLASRGTIPLAAALAEPSLLFSMPGVGLRSLVEEAARGLGIALDARVELRSQRALLAMAAFGGGVAFSPSIAARGTPGTVAIRTEPALRRQVGWARRRGRHLGPIAFALLDAVAAEAARAAAGTASARL
jgi:DNA-binding transcriptional LysR family regulator